MTNTSYTHNQLQEEPLTIQHFNVIALLKFPECRMKTMTTT